MKVITTTIIVGKIEALFICLVFEEEIRHVKGHIGPIIFTLMIKGADYMYIHVPVNK